MFPRSIKYASGSFGFKSGSIASATNHQESLLIVRRQVVTSSSDKSNRLAVDQRSQDKEQQESVKPHKEQEEASQRSIARHEARLANLALWHSIDCIKRLGHNLAHLDPLNLTPRPSIEQLTWAHSLLRELESKRDMVDTEAFLATEQPLMATNELINTVWSIYANSDCGLEFDHLSSEPEREWLTSEWEKLNETAHLDSVAQHNTAKLLLECETFDHFLAAKYPTVKRYSCEGAEPMLVVFDEILRLCHLGERQSDCEWSRSIDGQIEDVVIGMGHRGRLNLLTCLLGMGSRVVFNKISGEPELDIREAWMAKGDVLSHLSLNTRFVYGLDRKHIGLSRDTPRPINLSLLPNPSHLEINSPMVMGVARGRAHNLLHGYTSSPKFPQSKKKIAHGSGTSESYAQFLKNILPIQVHGDASLAGQGIVQESLQMSHLPKFSVGGSIHLVINNQIGYTTDCSEARSSRRCTDILKLNETPIIHVNADNLTGVVRATRLALAYRQTFGKDVAIDLVCYRKHGHNELDEPSFTQPLMYSAVRNRKSIPQSYCDQIGMDEEQRSSIVRGFKEKLQAAYNMVEVFKQDNDNYRNFSLPSEYHRDHVCTWTSGVDLELLKSVALASVETPDDFVVHPTLQKSLISSRKSKFSVPSDQLGEVEVDWATSEILALGSLLKQNQSVRISGQDVERGTFSTRHAVLVDQQTGHKYVPLNHMATRSGPGEVAADGTGRRGAQLEVANSILSEEAVLAYEFGYSIETCALTIWEAQFGDFFNTAQSVIDTLISSSEAKWLRQSPLTLLLPHGLDGAGPEHSSSHLERFLQMSSSSFDSIDTDAKVNWSICYPTLPSQYFHLLRRQVLRPYRKPLVVMSPKAIFRHPQCISPLSDLGPDQSFKRVLNDPNVRDAQQVDTVVLCTGKVYFTISEHKRKLKLDNVAIIRIEELCPFPVQSLVQTMRQYPNVAPNNYVWFQEEHKNQGAYTFVDSRLSKMANIELRYMGRPTSELPATGSGVLHRRELETLMREFDSLKRSAK